MNRKREDLLLEQFEDTQLALLMSAYAKDTGTQLLEEFEKSNASDLPEELDRKCQTLIQREFARRKRSRQLRTAIKLSGRVAAFFLAVIGTCIVLIASVEAIRTPTINFIIGANKAYSTITFPDDITLSTNMPTGEPTVDRSDSPLEGMIPEDYRLKLMNYHGTDGYVCFYEDSEGNNINFHVSKAGGTINFDTEDAIVTEINILGNKGVMVEKRGYSFYWLDQETAILCDLWLENWEYEEAWALAETVAACPDWVYIIPEE